MTGLGILGFAFSALTSPQASRNIEFFESRIRPILTQDCYECHQSDGVQKGGLVLDHREALLKGGNSGPAIIPGNPDQSLLIKAIRHMSSDLEMPKSGAPLEPSVVRDFETWIRNGAVDPRDQAPSEDEISKDTDWKAIMERRKNWWSFLPVANPIVPQLNTQPQPEHPVDAFIQKSLEANNLQAAGMADKKTLLRRLSFTLLGLPPSPTELEAFLANTRFDAFEQKVDEYLDSPHFGERWARHWMDWIRYAESHGSEGDPNIPNAWFYRDYLIRALNQDVPYDQLLLEHLAGDLLPTPRINEALGLNESAIGPAQLRMVFHGFAPTDALEEQVRFTDDQINVISKAFQGITVSCARCHDHKFDPISQKDFYAWYGIMASGRPAMIQASVPPKTESSIRSEMGHVKQQIKKELIQGWQKETSKIETLLANPSEPLLAKINASKKGNFLWPLAQFDLGNEIGKHSWKEIQTQIESLSDSDNSNIENIVRWDFTQPNTIEDWFTDGPSISIYAPAGTWTIAPSGDTIVQHILPTGSYSHIHTTKDRGLLHSRSINVDAPYDLWLLINGDGNAMARYAVQNYPRNGTVYPVETMNGARWRWKKFPLDYWKGDKIHIELSTASDQPVLARLNQTRSWFGIREAVLVPSGNPSPDTLSAETLSPVLNAIKDSSLESKNSLIRAYQTATQQALDAWRQDTLTDNQSIFLNNVVQNGLLTNKPVTEVSELASLLNKWRQLEEQLKPAIRVPGQFETEGYDQVLFERGNHKKPQETVPRRYLEFLDDSPYESTNSGRLELAQDMLRDDNPLTARVMVNRIWHHLFGKGIVSTPDNFGRLGQKPTHPEMLDFLAYQFKKQGWSIKQMIRYLVTTETWKRSSEVSDFSATNDPDNLLWSHHSLRRLEAETIRDNLLSSSGKLDLTSMYGEPVNGNSSRRSVYVRVKRNNLDPFLTLFDAPVPASTRGRRDATNVPGQSLSMLNDPFVIDCSEAFASSSSTQSGATNPNSRQRIQSMFVKALGRFPTMNETIQSETFLKRMELLNTENQTTTQTLQQQSEKLVSQLEQLEASARIRILAKRQPSDPLATGTGPDPTASWDFSKGNEDLTGHLDLTLMGEAKIKDGLLILNGNMSYAKSTLLQKNITEKTLEAWVRLDNLDQRGGGVISIQDQTGSVFDAIVFGEQESHKWLAGSNGFQRTQSMNGPAEQLAHEELVHLAITYQADGTIKGFRNGQPYGKAYPSNGPVRFKNGNAHFIFGNRHGSPGGNRLLKGAIAMARLYDRALTPDEIQASFNKDPNYVSLKDLIAELNSKEQKRRLALKIDIQNVEKRLMENQSKKGLSSPWADLAHAIFNLKEFIYVQ